MWRENPKVVDLGEADEGGVEGRKVRVVCFPFLTVGVTSPREREDEEDAEESGVEGLRTIGEGALGRLNDMGLISNFFFVVGPVGSAGGVTKLTCFRTPNLLVKLRGFLLHSPEDEEDELLDEMEVEVKALTKGPVGTRPLIAF